MSEHRRNQHSKVPGSRKGVDSSAVEQLPAARKSLGQHWLTDTQSLDAICDAAGVNATDHVLEIGPGTGELTARLLQRGASVTALEIDARLISGLKKRFSEHDGERLDVQEGDIRTFDLSALPPDYKIVANIPYYLSAHLLRLLTETRCKPKRAALLVQKEVAERVAAEPGGMSFISVSTQLYYETFLGWLVPAHLFLPPPKVDSQVLILNRRDEPLYLMDDEKRFFRLVKAGFSARRKTLLNSLSGGLRLPKDKVQAICDEAGVEAGARPQTLSIGEWYALYRSAEEA
jgi:16S rRNA (adenine1518-N6/adenine1519-N6)-dimethyltransferase